MGPKEYTVYLFSQTGKTLWKQNFRARDDKDADSKGHKLVLPQLDKHDDAEDWVVEPKLGNKQAALVRKITQGAVKALFKRDHWRLDRHNQSYEMRTAEFYSIRISEFRHTGTKEHHFLVVWYTGNPSQYWNSKTVDTLREAVTVANKHKEESDRLSAEELGEDPTGKLATQDKVPGGLADNKKPSDFDPKELAKGIKVEMEHTEDPALAQEIAMDHLTEFPDYYTALLKMEKGLEKKAARGSPPSKALLKKSVEEMRLYLGSVDHITVSAQQKLRNKLDKSLARIQKMTGMDNVDIWEQVEAQAQKLGVIRPKPGQHYSTARVAARYITKRATRYKEMQSVGIYQRLLANAHETNVYLIQQRLRGRCF